MTDFKCDTRSNGNFLYGKKHSVSTVLYRLYNYCYAVRTKRRTRPWNPCLCAAPPKTPGSLIGLVLYLRKSEIPATYDKWMLRVGDSVIGKNGPGCREMKSGQQWNALFS